MHFSSLSGGIAFCFYVAGVFCAGFALWKSRTPQGAVAWIVGLIGFPFLTVPLFLIFGASRFNGYIKDRKKLDRNAQRELKDIEQLYNSQISPPGPLSSLNKIANMCLQPGFTSGNLTTLLIDGEETFKSMLNALELAESYILFQFFIFRADEIGQKFADLLKKKSKAGVKVYFLYDAIGTRLKSAFLRDLESAGIETGEFRSTKLWRTSLQLNFRNHRKVIVVDGITAFVGGFNIGDDYLGKFKAIGPWRDTQVKLEGPASLAAQMSFVKDWYWTNARVPDLIWEPARTESNGQCLVLHTGPADDVESNLLAHISLINSATERIWIANPYFVPPEGLMNALEAAVLRGVEVKLMVPSYSDNLLITWASKLFLERALKSGIEVFEYLPGFLHQKVLLIDDHVGLVGSTNLDFRSMFTNFEMVSISIDPVFSDRLARMLESDFVESRAISYDRLVDSPLWRRIIWRVASLLAPIL